MEIQGQTDVSKVSSEPHKHKSPALRLSGTSAVPPRRKLGKKRKGFSWSPRGLSPAKGRGLPKVGDPPSQLTEVLETGAAVVDTAGPARGEEGRHRGSRVTVTPGFWAIATYPTG